MVTGTQIANEILEMYREFCDVSKYLQLLSLKPINNKGGYSSANLFNGYS
jgi:hypothetical protein